MTRAWYGRLTSWTGSHPVSCAGPGGNAVLQIDGLSSGAKRRMCLSASSHSPDGLVSRNPCGVHQALSWLSCFGAGVGNSHAISQISALYPTVRVQTFLGYADPALAAVWRRVTITQDPSKPTTNTASSTFSSGFLLRQAPTGRMINSFGNIELQPNATPLSLHADKATVHRKLASGHESHIRNHWAPAVRDRDGKQHDSEDHCRAQAGPQ